MHSNSKEATKLVNFVMVFLKLRLLALFIAALAMGKTQVQAENLLLGDENYTSKIHEMKGSARELMRSICPKNAANLETKLNDSFTCIEEIDDNENMMCDVLLQTKTCIKPLIDSMEHCVSPAEKGIYTYVMNTIYAIFKYVCHLDGEHFFELTNPCILKRSHPTFRRCMFKLKHQKAKYSLQNIPEKTELCLFVQEFKSCFETNLHSSCKSPVTREALMGLYNNLLLTSVTDLLYFHIKSTNLT
ncbi:hypothetical protein HUJ05_008008 [Dendroctonus ponderosae]|nr:hypothetical protein HUJ05_008008 [Dendroctonus ponderosae]